MDKMASRKLVLFDFDGTLTRKNTLWEIIKYIHGKGSLYRGLFVLFPYMVLFKIGMISNQNTKEKVLTYFFKDMACDSFQEKCDEFATERLPALIRKGVIEKMAQLRDEGTMTIIVSASAENWIAPWCLSQGIPYIATRLEVENGRITGKIKGKNCTGIEKVNRIQQAIDLSNFDEIIAYGDSKGDLPMLQLATQGLYKAFN
jgi:HAD superfamily hydrolase (TIGR01490 family)